MTTRIYQDRDEIRFEATDTVHVHIHRPLKDRPQAEPVVTIEELDPDELDPNDPGKVLIRWRDIDLLIDALQDLKKAL